MKRRNRFLVTLVSVIILMIGLSLLFSGCGRRARIARALQEQQQEDIEEENIKEDVEEDIEAEDILEDEDSGTEQVPEIHEESGEEMTPEEEVSDNPSFESEEEEVIEEEVVEEDIDEEEVVEEDLDEEDVEPSESIEQYTSQVPFVSGECGNIIGGVAYSDPVVYPGDNGSEDLEVRGFVSFDISSLAGGTIIEANISANADNLFGTPFNTYGPLLVKAVYWGPRAIMPSDYDLDGVELRNVTNKNFGIQNRNLKEDLQRAIDSGSGRYQLIFYFEMNGTDGDGEADNITYYLDEIIFTATYNQ